MMLVNISNIPISDVTIQSTHDSVRLNDSEITIIPVKLKTDQDLTVLIYFFFGIYMNNDLFIFLLLFLLRADPDILETKRRNRTKSECPYLINNVLIKMKCKRVHLR